jgi:hypothetical protein
MGATIGVSVMGVIVNAGLPPQASSETGVALHRLPPALREALASALKPAFLAATVVALLVWVIAVTWVKEVPLRRSVERVAAAEAAAGTPNPGGAVDTIQE